MSQNCSDNSSEVVVQILYNTTVAYWKSKATRLAFISASPEVVWALAVTNRPVQNGYKYDHTVHVHRVAPTVFRLLNPFGKLLRVTPYGGIEFRVYKCANLNVFWTNISSLYLLIGWRQLPTTAKGMFGVNRTGQKYKGLAISPSMPPLEPNMLHFSLAASRSLSAVAELLVLIYTVITMGSLWILSLTCIC